jgi:very-short-patch-repair endonuclease
MSEERENSLLLAGRPIPARAEKALWRILRHGELSALNWRKQAKFRQYVLDFVSHPAGLVIEADGAQHSLPEQKAHDQKRTELLESEGYKVLRFWNAEILSNGDGVFRAVLAIAMESPARSRILRWRDLHQTSPSMGEVAERSEAGGGEGSTSQDEAMMAPTINSTSTSRQHPSRRFAPPSPLRGG